MSEINNKQKNNDSELISRFGNDGSLIWEKLKEYIPPMMITNLSTLLLVTVDGLVVGNLVNDNALASVNFFYPITLIIGVISMLVASGCSTAIANSIGSNDQNQIGRIKHATILMMVIFTVFVAIVQIPVVYALINFGMKGLSDETLAMVWQYAIGIMISMPFGLVSTVGTYQLEIVGKMKLLVKLSVMEGIANLIFDLFFVGALNMGVAGAGFGTAVANALRCIVTIICISKKTDMYKCGENKASLEDIKGILYCGMPEAASSLMVALQNYFFIQILLTAFGDGAGVIRGICAFCYSIACVVTGGIMGGMRPLIGFLSGAKDEVGTRNLLRQCLKICTIIIGAITIVILLFPKLFFDIHGVDVIPEGGILSLRLYSLFFVLDGYDGIFQLFFINRKESGFITILEVLNGVLIVVFAFIFERLFPPPYIWLAYLITLLIVIGIDALHYISLKKNDSVDDDAEILYLSVKPEDATEASKLLEDYVIDKGYPENLANRLSLCLEEMVSYSVNKSKNIEIRKFIHQKVPPELLVELLPDDMLDRLREALHKTKPDEPIPQFPGDVLKKLPKDLQELIQHNVEDYIIIRLAKDEMRFIIIDTGRRIALNEDTESKNLVTENYTLIKKLSKSIEYEYVLDMNYSVITI